MAVAVHRDLVGRVTEVLLNGLSRNVSGNQELRFGGRQRPPAAPPDALAMRQGSGAPVGSRHSGRQLLQRHVLVRVLRGWRRAVAPRLGGARRAVYQRRCALRSTA